MTIEFRYEFDQDALQIDGNGCVKSCQAKLIGRCSETGYEASVSISNKVPCALKRNGVAAFVEFDDVDEADCLAWIHERIGLKVTDPDFAPKKCDQPPAGFLTAEAGYKDHLEKIIARDLANLRAEENMTETELRAKQTPFSAPVKSFQITR